MIQRWVASALVEAEPRFRRARGYRDLRGAVCGRDDSLAAIRVRRERRGRSPGLHLLRPRPTARGAAPAGCLRDAELAACRSAAQSPGWRRVGGGAADHVSNAWLQSSPRTDPCRVKRRAGSDLPRGGRAPPQQSSRAFRTLYLFGGFTQQAQLVKRDAAQHVASGHRRWLFRWPAWRRPAVIALGSDTFAHGFEVPRRRSRRPTRGRVAHVASFEDELHSSEEAAAATRADLVATEVCLLIRPTGTGSSSPSAGAKRIRRVR